MINIHHRIHNISFLCAITFFFLSHNIWFCPEWLWVSEILHLHVWEALSQNFQVIIVRGESFEAGGSSVLSSQYTGSIALLVILHAKEINPTKQIFLMLTSKTKYPPPASLTQNIQDKSFYQQIKMPSKTSHEASII